MKTAALAGLLATASAFAMMSSAQAQTAPAAGAQVTEVVVTATRREERLQDVPLAVTAITAAQFNESSFKNPIDLQYLSPSVQVSASGGIGFNLRGVGTNSFNSATEQTVGLAVDGVTYGFVDDIGGDISDTDRIEVLRGPQGTQFGKNASGGLISITTKRPTTSRFSVDARGSYGELNDTNDSLLINAPISSTLAASLGLSFQSRDGFAYNPVLKYTEGKQEQLGEKFKLLWTPTDKLSVYVSLDHRFAHWSPNFLSTYRAFGIGAPPNPPGLGVAAYGIVAGPKNTQVGDGHDSFRHSEVGGASTEINYKAGDFTVTSLTAYRFLWRKAYSTLGGTPIIYVDGPSHEHDGQFSQELRLTSPTGGLFQYVGGLYYYERSSHSSSILSGPFGGLASVLFGPGQTISFSGGKDRSTYKVKSYAAFADGTLNLSEAFKVAAGGRVGRDQADASQSTQAILGVHPLFGAVNGPSSGSVEATNYAYRIGPQYYFTKDVMAYATASRGYKGPLALPVAGLAVKKVNSEIVNSYELGLKSTFWEHRATLNVALFSEKFTDFQTNVLDTLIVPPQFELGNAGGLRTSGVEVETTLQPMANLRLNANLTYQDAHFTDFRTSCYSSFEPIPERATTNTSGAGGCYTIPGTMTSFTQAAGAAAPNASKWNLTLSGSYSHPINEQYNVDLNANYLYRSAFFTNGADPNTRIPGYAVVGINAGVGPADGRWRLGVFVRNLFNTYYVSAIETGIFDTGALTNVLNPEARRTVGVALEAHF